MKLLSDEEIKNIVHFVEQLPDLTDMEDDLPTMLKAAVIEGAKAQLDLTLKEVGAWGEEPCGKHLFPQQKKRKCIRCWHFIKQGRLE